METEREFITGLITEAVKAGVQPAHLPDVINRAYVSQENHAYASHHAYVADRKAIILAFFASQETAPSTQHTPVKNPALLPLTEAQARNPYPYWTMKAEAARTHKQLIIVPE